MAKRLVITNTAELESSYLDLALSPDGRRLATSSAGQVRVWTLDLDELFEIARSRLTRSLSPAECVTYHFESSRQES